LRVPKFTKKTEGRMKEEKRRGAKEEGESARKAGEWER